MFKEKIFVIRNDWLRIVSDSVLRLGVAHIVLDSMSVSNLNLIQQG